MESDGNMEQSGYELHLYEQTIHFPFHQPSNPSLRSGTAVKENNVWQSDSKDAVLTLISQQISKPDERGGSGISHYSPGRWLLLITSPGTPSLMHILISVSLMLKHLPKAEHVSAHIMLLTKMNSRSFYFFF